MTRSNTPTISLQGARFARIVRITRMLRMLATAAATLRDWIRDRIDAGQLGPGSEVEIGRHTGARI